MPVLTPRLNHTEAQQAVGNHFEVVTLTDNAQGDDADEKKLLLTFLHGRRSGEPVRFKQWRGTGPSAKSSLQQQDKYDRFLFFGVPGSSTVCALFTATPQHSRILLRYFNYIRPGTTLHMLNVDLKGTLQSENLLLDTEEPLVPTAESHSIETPLSFDVEHETAMKWFAVTTNDLKLTRVAIAPSACFGKLYDGTLSSPGKERTCLCLEKSGLGSNALRARVSWQEAGRQRTSKQVN